MIKMTIRTLNKLQNKFRSRTKKRRLQMIKIKKNKRKIKLIKLTKMIRVSKIMIIMIKNNKKILNYLNFNNFQVGRGKKLLETFTCVIMIKVGSLFLLQSFKTRNKNGMKLKSNLSEVKLSKMLMDILQLISNACQEVIGKQHLK